MVDAGAEGKLKVFISYSRKDSAAFADELVGGLELAGFAPFLDRHDIAAGEDWEARLGDLIAQSDTVVFVVSPEAVKSERCVWEVDKTLALSKRLLPVIYKAVTEADIPTQLRRLQFVRFDIGHGVTRPLGQLSEALRQDIDWIREHTRFGELAARWQLRGRPESLLLRGDELDAAKAWEARRKPAAPVITDAQRTFIRASEKTENVEKERSRRLRRQALRMQVFVGGLLFAIVAMLAYAGWSYQAYLKARLAMLSEIFWPRVLTEEAERALLPNDAFRECGSCPEMVVVQTGEFMMGSSNGDEDERPVHKVTMSRPFALSKFEVTFDQWDACVALGGCVHQPGDQGWGRGSRPVINVSWYDAQQYVAWLSKYTGKTYRLLSEAEWEYTARAGNNRSYPWGDAIGNGNANCGGCGSQWDNKQTAPVGSFAANGFGLHDMHGNVWEWVEDCYEGSYDRAPTDGSARSDGECDLRVLRGGSWDFGPQFLRSALRLRDATESRRANVGFRVGRTFVH
jgi:formylglycine-generating enzyme required for sulfatase activity